MGQAVCIVGSFSKSEFRYASVEVQELDLPFEFCASSFILSSPIEKNTELDLSSTELI